MKNWLLEPRGTDPFHPDYGSTLDGGDLPDGSHSDSLIGQLISRETMLSVESEIRRVLGAYQQQQLDRINADAIRYGGKNTMSPGEILAAVVDVQLIQAADVLLARVTIRTASGDALTFSQPVT